MKQGETQNRLDAWFNHPRYAVLDAKLGSSAFDTPALGEVLLSIAGGATPKRGDDSLYAEEGIRFLRILNVDDGEVNDNELKYIASAVHDGELRRSRLTAGDVLMTIPGRVGSAAVVRKEHLPANINQHLARLRIDPQQCRPEFVSAWLNSPAGLALSNRHVSGGTRAALDYGAIRGLRIPLPDSLSEQDRLLAAMDATRAERKAKLSEADSLMASLDDFVLDASGIAPQPKDTRQAFAVRQGDIKESQLSPARYMPNLQTFLNLLSDLPYATQPLGTYVQFNPKVDMPRLGDLEAVGFIPMDAVSDGATGDYTLETKPLADVRKGYTPFADRDILWAKITPCMQNGKTCIVDGLPSGIGFGSTEFHVLRVSDPEVLTEFVKEFISQRSLRQAATYAFTGSAGQQRVPAEFLANLPFPKLSEMQQRKIIEELSAIRTKARRLAAEAETSWLEAKQWFEAQLLGPEVS